MVTVRGELRPSTLTLVEPQAEVPTRQAVALERAEGRARAQGERLAAELRHTAPRPRDRDRALVGVEGALGAKREASGDGSCLESQRVSHTHEQASRREDVDSWGGADPVGGGSGLGERRGGALSGHTLGRRLADPTRKVGDTEREDEGAATIEERSGEQHNASAGRE
eukprot:scaffold143139_cov118-Phaeocystis_antarctica.AAC.1